MLPASTQQQEGVIVPASTQQQEEMPPASTQQQEEMPPASTEETETQKRKRGGRGKNQMPTQHYSITEVTEAGVPTQSQQAQAAFRRACASLGRTRVRITYPTWKDVPQSEKNLCWESVKRQFTFPADCNLAAVERQALLKMCKAWKNLKSELYNTYVKHELVPNPDTYPYLEDQWTDFVARCKSEEFQEQSRANKERQSHNTHPHRLGTGGYARKELDWNREDEQAALQNRPAPFSQIPERRARNWLRARAASSGDGPVSCRKPETEQVAQRILQLSEESIQGSFQPSREKDILTSALGNKEHPGRTRGIGVSVPWKLGFPDDASSYRSRRRNKFERAAAEHERLQAMIAAEVEAKLKEQMDMMKEQMDQRVEEQVIERIRAMTELRSSCASAPDNEPDNMQHDRHDFHVSENEEDPISDGIPKEVTGERYPVDEIETSTKCMLLMATVVGSDNIIEVGRGLAFQCSANQNIHGRLLEPGYAKVTVDMIHPNCMDLPVPIPPMDDVNTLGQALHYIIQWPKKFIKLVAPPQPSRPLDPVKQGRDFSFKGAPPKVQQGSSSKSSQRSGKTASSEKRRANKQKAKSNEVEEEEYVPSKYVQGLPLVSERTLKEYTWAARNLHDLYLRRCSFETELSPNFSGRYQHKHFLKGSGDFTIDFSDLFLLYRLDKLDVNLLRCWTL